MVSVVLRVPWMEASIKEAKKQKVPRTCSESLEAKPMGCVSRENFRP